MIDQFENVVKNEIRSHNTAIEKSNNSLNELKEMFREFHLENKNLKSTNESLYAKTQKHFDESKKDLEKSFKDQRAFLKENEKRVNFLLDQLKKDSENYIGRKEFEDLKDENDKAFGGVNQQHLKGLNRLELEMYKKDSETRLLLSHLAEEFDEKLQYLKKKIDRFSDQLIESNAECAGVLRELQVYKKNMFILEKKIENIYTLIERLNKRVSECRKLA